MYMGVGLLDSYVVTFLSERFKRRKFDGELDGFIQNLDCRGHKCTKCGYEFLNLRFGGGVSFGVEDRYNKFVEAICLLYLVSGSTLSNSLHLMTQLVFVFL